MVQSLKTAKDDVERDVLVELARRSIFADRPSMRYAISKLPSKTA